MKYSKSQSQRIESLLNEVIEAITPQFRRREVVRSARHYIEALIINRNKKSIAELARTTHKTTPYQLRNLVSGARWDAGFVRNELRNLVLRYHESPFGILNVEEAGFMKYGEKSPGVSIQHNTTTGLVQNCQTVLFLAYHTGVTLTFFDLRLFIPKDWYANPKRLDAARIPEQIARLHKADHAFEMITKAIQSKVTFRWVTACEAVSNDADFAKRLETHKLNYVLKIPPTYQVHVLISDMRVDVQMLTRSMPTKSWTPITWHPGTALESVSEWSIFHLNSPSNTQHNGILIRHRLSSTESYDYYRCSFHPSTTLHELVYVAQCLSDTTRSLRDAQQRVGLGDYEGRSFKGWYRHVTLSLLAYFILATSHGKKLLPEIASLSPLPLRSRQ